MNCQCEVITEQINFCEPHHRYWLGGNRLPGVTSVINDVLPTDYDGIPEHVLENARVRGVEADALMTGYVNGTLTEIPAGVREDARDLFLKFKDWFDKQNFKTAQAQILVHDTEIAGLVDLKADGVIFDVKCVSEIKPSHHMQVAGYSELDYSSVGYGHLIHLTKRHKVARIMDVSQQSFKDWRTVRQFWELKRRLS